MSVLDCRYYIKKSKMVIYSKDVTFSMILLPPKRVTNSAGEATVKSLCRSMRRRSLPCFTKCSPDMLGLFSETQRMHLKAPRNANSMLGMYSTLKQALILKMSYSYCGSFEYSLCLQSERRKRCYQLVLFQEQVHTWRIVFSYVIRA